MPSRWSAQIALQQPQGPAGQLLLILGFPELRGGVGPRRFRLQLRQALFFPGFPAFAIAELIEHERAQPVTELASVAIILERGQRLE